MKKVLLPLILLACIQLTQAQEKPPLVTDRPDQTEAPVLVPRGALQIETGFAIESDKAGGFENKNTTLNTTLTKYGVNEFFELRLITEFLKEEQIQPIKLKATGLAPVALGLKMKLADEKGFWPQAAMIGHINLRKTDGDLQASNSFMDFRFTFSHGLTDRLNLSYNVGAEWGGETPDAAFLYTLSFAYAVSDRVGAFIEGYSFFPETSKADNRADAGVTVLLSDMIQWDVSAGIGLSENAPDNFISTGLSVRLFK